MFRAKDDLTEQVAAEYEEFPSSTPREGQDEKIAETSLRKPRSHKVNQLLEQIHELEVLDREIKRNNAILTKRNKELHNSVLEMRGVYVLLKIRNLTLMKDNTRLYRMIILMRLQKKNANPSPQTQLALETLAEAETNF